MNCLTVIQASQGLASYICEKSSNPSVVIGHDHRYNSSQFARLTAGAMMDKGIKVMSPLHNLLMTRAYWLERLLGLFLRRASTHTTCPLRDKNAWSNRGRHDHCFPQSRTGQRIQGVLVQRLPDNPPTRQEHSPPYREKSDSHKLGYGSCFKQRYGSAR